MPTSSWPYGTMAVGHPGSIVTPLGAEGKAASRDTDGQCEQLHASVAQIKERKDVIRHH